MERIWLDHYPPGMPAEIDVSRYASVVALFEESFENARSSPAFVFMDRTLTYGDVDALSRALAAFLQSRGLKPGARVALMMPNVLQYPVAIAAALRAGFVVVNVNPLYTPRELEFQLVDSGAEAIIVLENFAHTLEQVIGRTAIRHVVVATIGDLLGTLRGALVNIVVRRVKKMVPAYSLPTAVGFRQALAAGRGAPFTAPRIGPDDIAFLQYTGGTTGVAKGAMLLHRNIIANTLQVDAWLRPLTEMEPKVAQLTTVMALPLYHIFALTACFLAGMRLGARCLLIPNARDLPNLIRELAKYPVNSFPAVNTLYNALLNHPDFGRIDWSALKCSVGGGMAVQQSVAERWLAATGSPIVEGYGLSETSPVLTCNPVTATKWNGTIGLPLPSTEMSIRDDDGREVALGEPGEICARGPQVMPGYWQRPDETARSFTRDGFFRTGDIGTMDQTGRIRIVDRKKDMILVSGFNVYPNEVEGVVASHPGVAECAVVGVADAATGEAVKLFVVRRDAALTEAALLAYCRERLTGYKLPRQVEFRDELPKTNVGKILRRMLRDEARQSGSEAA